MLLQRQDHVVDEQFVDWRLPGEPKHGIGRGDLQFDRLDGCSRRGDERAYQSIGDVTSELTDVTEKLVAAPIQPRTFGIEVDYRF